MTDTLPKNFSWHDINGKSYITFLRNQNNPKKCGSCWAISIASALSDRIKIWKNASWPEIVLSPQQLLSCSTTGNACQGVSQFQAYKDLVNDVVLVDESCSQYVA